MGQDITRIYTSGMAGAPSLMTRSSGSLKNLLEQVLTVGFNTTAADDVTYDAQAGEGVILISGGHDFVTHQAIEISGANEAAWNDVWKVTGVTTTTVRFAMDTVPAINATGTLSVKTASAGWTMTHESANGRRAIFKPGVETSLSYYVWNDNWMNEDWAYADDEHIQSYIRGCSGADDIEAGMINGEWGEGGQTFDSSGTSSSYNFPRTWRVVANHRFVWLLIEDDAPGTAAIEEQSSLFYFGDLANGRASGRDAVLAQQQRGDYDSQPTTKVGSFIDSKYKRVSRGYAETGQGVEYEILSYVNEMGEQYIVPDGAGAPLSVETNMPVLAVVPGGGHVKVGELPGLGNCLNGQIFTPLSFVEIEGRQYWVWNFSGNGTAAYSERNKNTALIDVTGPWH